MLTCIQVLQIAILPNGNSYFDCFDWCPSVHALDGAHHSGHVGWQRHSARRLALDLVTLEAERR
jgi:hypothetical protein